MKPVEVEFLVKNQSKSTLSDITSDFSKVGESAKSATSTSSANMKSAQAEAEALRNTIVTLKSELVKMQALSDVNIDTSEGVASVELMKKTIEDLKVQLIELDKTAQTTQIAPPPLPGQTTPMSPPTPGQTTPKSPPSNTARQWDGLGMSFQQMARELPSLAMGPQMFILAISNNLPIFTDALKRARMEYDNMVASGQKATPVWKQVLGSVFSWQTGMMVAISLLSKYGNEIIKTTKEVLNLETAEDKLKKKRKERAEIEKEAVKESEKMRIQLLSSAKAIKEFTGTQDEERQKVDELNKQYGAMFGNYQTLSDWYNTLTTKAKAYTEVIFQQRKQEELINKSVEAQAKIEEMRTLGADQASSKLNWAQRTAIRLGGRTATQTTDEMIKADNEARMSAAIAKLQKQIDDYNKQLDDSQKKEEELINSNKFDDVVAGSVRDLENAIAVRREALKDLTNKSDYEATLKEIEIFEKRLAAITGGDDKNKNKADSDKQRQRDDYNKLIAEQLAENEKTHTQMRLDAINDRREKVQAAYEVELASLAKIEEKARSLTPAGETFNQDPFNKARNLLTARRDVDLSNINKEEQEALSVDYDTLLSDYVNYEERRNAIRQEYIDKRALAREGGASEEFIARLSEAEAKSLQVVDNEELEESLTNTTLLVDLFSKADYQSKKTLKSIIAETQKLVDYINGIPGAELPLGITEQQADMIAKNADQVQAVMQGLYDKQEELDTKTNYPLSGFVKGYEALKRAQELQKKAQNESDKTLQKALNTQVELEKQKGLQYITDGALQASEGLNFVAESFATLAEASSDSRMAEAAEQLSAVAQNFSAAAQGAASGGWIGAIVAGVTDLLGQTVEAIASVDAAQAAYEQNRLDFINAYELSLLELQEADYETIFGVDSLTRAADAYVLAMEALKKYNALVNEQSKQMDIAAMQEAGASALALTMAGQYNKTFDSSVLRDIQVRTHDYKPWANFWGKDDKYQSLDEYAPQIFNGDELNIEELRLLLDTNIDIEESQRTQLQNVLDLHDQYTALMDEVKSELASTFGGLGSSITDAIVQGVEDGADSFSMFKEAGNAAIEELGEKLMYTLFFAEKFKKLEEDLLAVEGTSVEDISNKQMQVVADFYAGIGSTMDAATAWVNGFKESAAESGFDIWSGSTTQTGQTNAFQTLTQDQGTKLEGLFTAMQMRVASIDDKMDAVSVQMTIAINHLQEIEANTKFCEYLKPLQEDIASIKRDGLKVK